MNSLIALVLLGQILGCTLSHHLGEHFDCNSKEAEQYAEQALQYINAHNLHGYKQVLNIIEDLHILHRRPHGEIIFIELKLLETKCHVLDPTAIENCTVRTQQEHAVEGDCNVKLLSDGGITKVVAAKCHSSPDSEEDVLKNCPDCPILLPLNDLHVLEVVEYVLQKHNEKNPGHIYKVLEISRGQIHSQPESVYVEFAIVETNCSNQEAHDGHHDCHTIPVDAQLGFCRATVFREHAATGKLTDEKFESDCVIFENEAGKSHVHLVEHHFGKHIPSPGHNHTVLDLIHSHNDTNTSHESHSSEGLLKVAAPVVKREVPPAVVPTAHHTHPVKLCPGNIHHFKV